jgi:hypothetical protein
MLHADGEGRVAQQGAKEMLQTSLTVALLHLTHSFLGLSDMWICAQFLGLPNRILLLGLDLLYS